MIRIHCLESDSLPVNQSTCQSVNMKPVPLQTKTLRSTDLSRHRTLPPWWTVHWEAAREYDQRCCTLHMLGDDYVGVSQNREARHGWLTINNDNNDSYGIILGSPMAWETTCSCNDIRQAGLRGYRSCWVGEQGTADPMQVRKSGEEGDQQ